MRHGHRYICKHLNNGLQAAQSRRDEEAEAKILAILHRERSRSYWRRLNYSMAKSKDHSVRTVQTVDDDGVVTDHTAQASVQEAIWSEIIGQRFHLTEQAPICQGQLCGDFGYMAFSPTARQSWMGPITSLSTLIQ